MNTTFPLPPPAATNVTDDHTDWLELAALADARRRRASIEDLVGALRRTSSTEALPEERLTDKGSEQAQIVAESALSLADERKYRVGAPTRYPFKVSGRALVAKPAGWKTTYAYLLLLSRFGEKAGPQGVNGSVLFEDVAAEAARVYLGGDRTGAQVYNFGFPRKRTPAKFKPAVEELCAKLHEGAGPRSRPRTQYQKDAKLDLVAWVPMPDKQMGKVIGFGQCATGNDWKTKTTELQPTTWVKMWLLDPMPMDPLRLFFLPHRISADDWTHHSHHAGIIFDRCRLTAYASNLDPALRIRVAAWNEHVIETRLRP